MKSILVGGVVLGLVAKIGSAAIEGLLGDEKDIEGGDRGAAERRA